MTTEEEHEKEINRYLYYVNYLLRENNQLKDRINNLKDKINNYDTFSRH